MSAGAGATEAATRVGRAVTLARGATALMGLVALGRAGLLGVSLRALRQITEGNAVEVGLSDLTDRAIAAGNAVGLGVAGVVGLCWMLLFVRALGARDALAVRGRLPSAASAVLAWVIPGVNLVRPAQVMGALLEGLRATPERAGVAPEAEGHYRSASLDRGASRGDPGAAPVALWWSFWVMSRLLAVAALPFEGNGDSASGLMMATALTMAAELLTAVSAVAGWRVLGVLGARVRARRESLVRSAGVC